TSFQQNFLDCNCPAKLSVTFPYSQAARNAQSVQNFRRIAVESRTDFVPFRIFFCAFSNLKFRIGSRLKSHPIAAAPLLSSIIVDARDSTLVPCDCLCYLRIFDSQMLPIKSSASWLAP